MSAHSRQVVSQAELMGDDIVGRFLSEDTLYNSHRDVVYEHPQLWRFVHYREDICEVQLYDSGEHGVAVLAMIKDILYLLKIFKRWKQPGPKFSPYPEALDTSPLAHESRAYARLKSINEDGTWATHCHGWMKLSDTQFAKIESLIPGCNLSRWVIVKDYIAETTNAFHIQEIHAKFEVAKKARIIPCDLQIRNYRGSKIVDLSSALTYPCPEWSEFLFKHFYEETVYGVFDWFEVPPRPPPRQASQVYLLVSTSLAVFAASFLWFRRKLL